MVGIIGSIGHFHASHLYGEGGGEVDAFFFIAVAQQFDVGHGSVFGVPLQVGQGEVEVRRAFRRDTGIVGHGHDFFFVFIDAQAGGDVHEAHQYPAFFQAVSGVEQQVHRPSAFVDKEGVFFQLRQQGEGSVPKVPGAHIDFFVGNLDSHQCCAENAAQVCHQIDVEGRAFGKQLRIIQIKVERRPEGKLRTQTDGDIACIKSYAKLGSKHQGSTSLRVYFQVFQQIICSRTGGVLPEKAVCHVVAFKSELKPELFGDSGMYVALKFSSHVEADVHIRAQHDGADVSHSLYQIFFLKDGLFILHLLTGATTDVGFETAHRFQRALVGIVQHGIINRGNQPQRKRARRIEAVLLTRPYRYLQHVGGTDGSFRVGFIVWVVPFLVGHDPGLVEVAFIVVKPVYRVQQCLRVRKLQFLENLVQRGSRGDATVSVARVGHGYDTAAQAVGQHLGLPAGQDVAHFGQHFVRRAFREIKDAVFFHPDNVAALRRCQHLHVFLVLVGDAVRIRFFLHRLFHAFHGVFLKPACFVVRTRPQEASCQQCDKIRFAHNE